MTAREAHVSRERSGGDGSLEIAVNVTDVHDDIQAIDQAFAFAPTLYAGRIRKPHPAVKVVGYATWLVTFKYEIPEDEEEEEQPPQNTVGRISFDISGVTQHITQCLEQIDYGAETGRSVKDAKVIGATGDSVEGTDTLFGQMRVSLTRFPPAVNGGYFKNLARLVGMTNQGQYTITGYFGNTLVSLAFADGELKFLGATPTNDFQLKYEFDASENRTNIDIGQGIVVASKKGHEYLWTMYKQEELVEPKVKIPVPHIAFVAKLPPGSIAFSSVLGF